MSDAGPQPVLAPLGDADWPPELADMLSGFAGGLNVYRTMAHHPALLRAWADLRDHIVNHSALGRDDLEVVILRGGHRLQSPYEWSQHIVRARKYGLTDPRIASLRGPLDAMQPGDAILCAAVDELFDGARLHPATLAAVTATFGTHAVFDLMATVGFYSTLGFILNTFGTPLDDDIHAQLVANPLRD
ncbi:carboxymuconolactone decarboxylase family protein [Tropicibacter oceani]|uniref:Carboxymuconolactone decarboxylase family protein n=1 Tax=Tropicibacter oceani TaxID=3058420 RepID=A0ABY8QGK8_9RHOB|nr:carboxymuconolactone decarboxylase family protein [Tropicibacter oceani]WGW03735.1 carboxymuconolactone decarboxylase family protein [Tropicibacter oceani]